MKKTLMILLAALLLTTCALAEEAAPTVCTSGDWRYILLDDGTAEIVGCRRIAMELTIPAEIDGCTVTSIGADPFYGCRSLRCVMKGAVPE